MDRLDAMRVFVRVVETGSFSTVARELGIGQPAVSKQIAALEGRVGAQLIRRTSRSLSVTQAGADFYATVKHLVEDLDAAVANAGKRDKEPSGLVRVTVAPVFGRLYIVPHLRALSARHPQLSVELLVSDRAMNLVEDNVDLAIRNGQLADSSLVAHPIGATPLVTVGSSQYLAKHGEPRGPADLDAHACITFISSGAPRAWRYANDVVHYPHGSFRSNDAEQIRAAVLHHLGLAQVPGWLVAPELASGEVRSVLAAHAPAPLPITAVRPAGRRLATKVRSFLSFFSERFAREPMLAGRPQGNGS
jgi:LysR family transcriptional regulator for bpeEF and oprC